MARRLTTDAKIVLERVGYGVNYNKLKGGRREMRVYSPEDGSHRDLFITGGTVDNDEVVKLLNARGFDEFGYACEKARMQAAGWS